MILRRVDDSFCDPLELRGESLLGVAGLVDAIVAGNVKVANALGSGLIETAAIMPFLPGLSTHLLGEKLKLPSVATWWCGQTYALDWVLDHLDSVVVKPAFPSRGMEPVFGAELPQTEKGKFTEQLRARPHEYVAQEQIALSTAPVWDDGCLNSRSVVLRTYVLNTGNGWIAIPGGLVRVAEAEGSVVSMQRGGHSKDAWVLWDGPIDTFSMLRPRHEPVELRRVSRVVPSSVADNVFWLGRYAERAEDIARILRSMIPRVRRAEEAEFTCLIRLHSCMESRHSKLPKAKDRRPSFGRPRTRNGLDVDRYQASGQSGLHPGRSISGWRPCSGAPVGRHDVSHWSAAELTPGRIVARSFSNIRRCSPRAWNCSPPFPGWSGKTLTAD